MWKSLWLCIYLTQTKKTKTQFLANPQSNLQKVQQFREKSMFTDVNLQYEPVLGDGLASCRLSEMLLMLPEVLPVPSWACCCCWSSCFSSMFPIRAFLMMSSRPRLLAGSLNEWFLGFTLPVKHKHTCTYWKHRKPTEEVLELTNTNRWKYIKWCKCWFS